MPELPEVETVRRGIERHLAGRRVDRVELQRADLRFPIPRAGVEGLAGRRLVTVDRRSKYLLLRFDGDGRPIALVHLGMSGRLLVAVVPRRSSAEPPWQLHEHWRMRFGDRVLRYVDARRFGVLDVVAERDVAGHRLLAGLGPEPFDASFDAAYLHARTRRRRVATKTFLMDASNVVGVGNIYASESCFRAGVRPGRAVARLSRAACARLVSAVRDVLDDAIRAGGTTLRDYVGADEEAGWFQQRLRVYDRAGEPCLVCRTPIRHTVTGQRSTYWCPRCQRA